MKLFRNIALLAIIVCSAQRVQAMQGANPWGVSNELLQRAQSVRQRILQLSKADQERLVRVLEVSGFNHLSPEDQVASVKNILDRWDYDEKRSARDRSTQLTGLNPFAQAGRVSAPAAPAPGTVICVPVSSLGGITAQGSVVGLPIGPGK